MITLTRLFSTVAVLGLCGIPPAAHAQEYPTKPITVVVPFPAGGPSDVVARIVAEQMGKVLGQTLVIENVGGAGGTIGSARVASASPDGYTLLAGSMGSHVSAPVLTPNVKYDSLRDFEPIGFTAHAPAVIVARKDFPADDLRAFLANLKQNGEAVKQAHGGIGASSHMACLLFTAATGTTPTLVAYRGTGPAMNDLVGGHVDFFCEQAVSVSGQINSGAIKAYAVSSGAAASNASQRADRERARGRLPDEHLGWHLRPQGCFPGDHREARRRARHRARRSRGAEAPCRPRRRGTGQGRAHAREIRRVRESRDRALVADPQGRICHSAVRVLCRAHLVLLLHRGPRQCFAAAKLAMLRTSRRRG